MLTIQMKALACSMHVAVTHAALDAQFGLEHMLQHRTFCQKKIKCAAFFPAQRSLTSSSFCESSGTVQNGDAELCPDSICILQDLKCLVFSLISAHYKIQPIQR